VRLSTFCGLLVDIYALTQSRASYEHQLEHRVTLWLSITYLFLCSNALKKAMKIYFKNIFEYKNIYSKNREKVQHTSTHLSNEFDWFLVV
jgi:hypothetical protein